MKPLLSRKVRRGQTLSEWEPAEHHLTLDGLRAFEQRQRERAEAAQAVREEAASKTVPLRKRQVREESA